jgi:hypothetical protein
MACCNDIIEELITYIKLAGLEADGIPKNIRITVRCI